MSECQSTFRGLLVDANAAATTILTVTISETIMLIYGTAVVKMLGY